MQDTIVDIAEEARLNERFNATKYVKFGNIVPYFMRTICEWLLYLGLHLVGGFAFSSVATHGQ